MIGNMSERESYLKIFGQNLRKTRQAKSLTQEKLADLAELDTTYISGLERGVRNPSLLSIIKIARACSVAPKELLDKIECAV
jgi:transcriptional regulator with XRE-family HTH domain